MYKVTISGTTVVRGDGIRPESQPVTLTERGSTSTITLGPDAPDISVGEWLLNDEWQEGEQLWRVRSVERQMETNTRTVQLDHAIKMLEDTKIFEDIETSDINGGDDAYARQAIEYVLSLQGDWRLGQFDYENVYAPYEFSGGTSVFDAVESVADTLEDCEWWYDVRTYPFLIHIKHRNATEACEMRSGRNISTMKVLIDRSGMYTRIYPVGENDLHITGDYISRNENVFGRVDKVETNQGISTEEGLWNWAEGRLLKHSEPVVTVTISGLDLSRQTGEQLDWIQLNRVCRCPLPEYNTTILERVTKLNWKDRQNDPETVTVTLSNGAADAETLTKQVSETSKTTGTAARGQAKQNYMFEANGEHLYYEVFDECGHLHSQLEMTEQSLRIGFENLNESTRAEFRMTSESLRVQFENEIASTRSEFQMTSESLRIHFENEIASTRSEFQMTSESLRISFKNEIASTRSEFQITSESLRISFENEISSVRSDFEMTAESLKISFENEIASTRSEFQMTSESLRVSFENEISSTRSEFQMTSESLRVSFENEISSTRSEFQMTSESLRVTFENEVSSVRSMVEQTDSSWRACVEGVVGADGKVTAASIGVAIDKNGSNAFINADKIHLTGDTLLSGFVTVDSGALRVTTALLVGSTTGNTVSINNGYVNAPNIQVNSGGNLTLVGSGSGEYYQLNAGNIQNFIKKAEVDGNTLKLWKFTDADAIPSITFSKATALTGAWSGDRLTVTASPQDEKWRIGFTANAQLDEQLTIYGKSGEYLATNSGGTVIEGYVYKPVAVGTVNSGSAPTERATADILVDASAVYSRGQTAGKNAVGLSVTVNKSNDIPYSAVIAPNKNSSATQSVTITVSPGSLNTTTGKRTISAMVGTTVADQEDITDYLVGKQNATVTMNTPAWNTVSELSDNRTLVVGAYNTDNSSKSASTEKKIYLVVGDNVAYIRDTTSSGTVVAQVQHDKRLGGYRAGWAAAYGKVSLPGQNTSTASMSVSTPPSATDGEATSTTYTMSSSTDNIVVLKNPGGTVVARLEHNKYNAGWAAAHGQVSLPSSASTASSFSVGTPSSTVGGTADSTTYTMSSSTNNIAVVKNPSGTVVARLEHNKYNAGWSAAYADVSLPSSSSTADNFSVGTPSSTVGGTANSTKYTMSSSTNDIAVVKNPGGTVVARLEHGKYTAGKAAYYNSGYWTSTVAADSDGNYVEIPNVTATAKEKWYINLSAIKTAYDYYHDSHWDNVVRYSNGYYVRIPNVDLSGYESWSVNMSNYSLYGSISQSGGWVSVYTPDGSTIVTQQLSGYHPTLFKMRCTAKYQDTPNNYIYTFQSAEVVPTSKESFTVGTEYYFYR